MRLVAKKEGVAIWEVVLSGNVSLAEDSPTHFLQQAVQWSFSQTKPGRKVVFGREGGKTSNQKWQAFLKDQGLHSSEEIFSELARAHKVQQKKTALDGNYGQKEVAPAWSGAATTYLLCFSNGTLFSRCGVIYQWRVGIMAGSQRSSWRQVEPFLRFSFTSSFTI
jgi:hypothetical protein